MWLGAASARAELSGRAGAEVRCGAGGASDLFLGAGDVATGTVSLAPGLGVDLSFAPWLKLFSRGDAALERYLSTGGTAYQLQGGLLLQARPLDWLYPELFAGAEQSWFQDLLGPADPSLPGLPSVTRTGQLQGGVALRAFWGPLELRGLGEGALRQSVGIEQVDERRLSLSLEAGLPAGQRVRLGAAYRFVTNTSPEPGFVFTGHAVVLNAAWFPVERLAVRLSLGLRHNLTPSGETDDFPRGSLALAVELWPWLFAELSATGELESSHNPDGVAQLGTVYAGLRVQGGPWRF